MKINVVNFNVFEKHSFKKSSRVSEMSSSLGKLLAVWSCAEEIVVL